MDEITMKDILECVGENINPARDIMGLPSSGVDMKATEGEAVRVNTNEFRLTKDYFENLGVIMQEYLTTTTLGDLSRKSRELNAATETTVNAFDTAIASETKIGNDISSVIRPSLGEINQ
jgi:Rrf2 family iron-sulfur cluster assembly transcriptional regulator